jgi:hypothetical protein
MSGEIVNPAMIDTLSVIGPTGYYPLQIGGVIYECKTIKTSLGAPDPEVPLPVIIMDPEKSPGTHLPVPGTPIPPYPGPPAPLLIDRPALLPVQNKSVLFEGKLVAVAGDHMTTAPTTTPPTRPIIQNELTSPTIYPTIKIGTQVPIS